MADQTYNFADVVNGLIKVETAMAFVVSQLSLLPCKDHMEKLVKANEELIKINERFLSEDRVETRQQAKERIKKEKTSLLLDQIRTFASPVIASGLTLIVYIIVEKYIRK